MKLSANAEKALVFQYILEKGLPADEDQASVTIRMFGRIAGLSESDCHAAFAELEDAGMLGREP